VVIHIIFLDLLTYQPKLLLPKKNSSRIKFYLCVAEGGKGCNIGEPNDDLFSENDITRLVQVVKVQR
jgi:hypothetical protein